MMRLLITGGRKFADRDLMWSVLDRLHAEHHFTLLIHSDARGADRLAGQWAGERGIDVLACPLDRKRYGRAAATKRNRQMLAEKPDLVVAFPGDSDTRHMVIIAEEARVKVIYPEDGPDKRLDLECDGYIVIADLLTGQEVAWYLECYEAILSGKIDAGQWRSDLGSGQSQKREGVENITQVMWPSELIPELLGSPAYQRGLDIARQLLGDDVAFDFDMLIDKAPGTDTPTPFHQDMAYWVDLPDRRAVSCWISLDEATVDNGCMWFAPGSHRLPLRQHRWHGKSGGALQCDGSESECVCVPLKPGSCTFHNGGVMHYSRGNSTAGHRRALIINFRPEAMIRLERERGFDHGKTRNVRENRT